MKNMERPLIAISSDSNASMRDGKPRRLVCPKAYAAAIHAAGGVPVLAMEYGAERFADVCDALLLSGGDDIPPYVFGEETLNETVMADDIRFEYEYALLTAFLAAQKPVFGICRGVQVINCFFGGDIYQDLPAQLGVCHRNDGLVHCVQTSAGSQLRLLLGPHALVNSTHHQAIRRVAPGFLVSAVSDDGVIEGIEHESLPVFGVQFHPEQMTPGAYDERTADCSPLFRYFLQLIPKR